MQTKATKIQKDFALYEREFYAGWFESDQRKVVAHYVAGVQGL